MKRILVVDDNKENLLILKATLEKDYQVTLVPSGKLALEYLEKKSTDMILLDVQMPEMDGTQVAKIIKEDNRLKTIPLLFLTGIDSSNVEASCLEMGGDDFIRKPFDATVLKRRISRILELYDLRYNLEDALAKKSRQLDKMTLSTIITVANTVDAKDKYTGGHSLRVAVCARDIAMNLGWDASEVQNVYNVALLHDIGKIAVPDSVLNKEERLTDEEFEIIKKHPVTGNEILSDITILSHVQEGAHYHHERWDGNGYPCKLKGEEIPIYARVIAIADSYDAMRSDRVYRKHLSTEKIISEFERCKGAQFDPDLADVFIFMLKGGYDLDPDVIKEKLVSIDKEADTDEDDGVLAIKNTSATDIRTQQDSLTGLFNKSFLNLKVGSKIMKDRCGALMLIDFDRFNEVNKNFGHLEGDLILRKFAEKLKEYVTDEDVVSRMNGDAFAIFVGGKVNRENVRRKAQQIIDDIRRSELSRNYDNMLSVSIGIALCPEDGITFSELYSAADKALYHGTRNGISMYHFFGSESEMADVNGADQDMNRIKNMIEGQFANEQGALSVEYDDFQNIYNYVYRYVDRNDNKVQVILFTISPAHGREIELSLLEQSMHNLDLAVVESLRKVDVGTRYSSNQYIVILTDTDAVNGKMVADRVIEQYYKLSEGGSTSVVYNLETLQPSKKKD